MAIAAITTSGPTITVTSASELTDAYQLLSTSSGGGTILLEGGDYGKWGVYPYGSQDGTEPVIIKSADLSDPAHFTEFYLRDTENIRIENIHVDGTEAGVSPGTNEFLIQNSSNIQVVGSVFTFDLDNTLKDADQVVDSGVMIRDSSGILFDGNYLEGMHHALQVTDVIGAEITGNEFTNMQGDGFRGGGLQDVTISGNYMHDFFGVDQDITHSDLIQVWGSNSYLLTQNLTISDNILITTDASSQSIFIRNEEFSKVGDPTSGFFQDITITGNLIYNGHLHGVYVADAEGVTVDNNTILFNPDATLAHGDNEPLQFVPKIVVKNAPDAIITDNITGGIIAPSDSTQSGNEIINYDKPSDTNYVGSHFANPLAGVDVSLEDLNILPSSPWYGTVGSIIGNNPGDVSEGVTAVVTSTWPEGDQYDVTYDASLSFDEEGLTTANSGYAYHWTFADGSTATGTTVNKVYEDGGFKGVELEIYLDNEVVASVTRNFAVQTKDIFEFNFEGGVVDLSDGSPEVIDNGTTTPSDDGTGFLIGDGNKLELGRGTDGLFNMDSFGLSLDLEPTGDEQSGIFLHLNQVMTGWVSSDGHLSFELTTDEGTYNLTSRDPVFDDGANHRIGIAFDGTTGQLEMFADGESVSSTEAWGSTAPPVYWNLVFGNTWGDSMDAIIDNVELSEDPSVAGTLPDIAPPVEDPPAEDPPAEDPPVEDPPAEDPGGRGGPRDAVESDGGGFFLTDLLDMLLSIFGLGKSDDEPVSGTAAASYDTLLDDLVPVTGMLDENLDEGYEDDEDDEIGLAA